MRCGVRPADNGSIVCSQFFSVLGHNNGPQEISIARDAASPSWLLLSVSSWSNFYFALHCYTRCATVIPEIHMLPSHLSLNLILILSVSPTSHNLLLSLCEYRIEYKDFEERIDSANNTWLYITDLNPFLPRMQKENPSNLSINMSQSILRMFNLSSYK